MTHTPSIEFLEHYDAIYGYYEGYYANSGNLLEFTDSKLESYVENYDSLVSDLEQNSQRFNGDAEDAEINNSRIQSATFILEYIEEYLEKTETIAKVNTFKDSCGLPLELVLSVNDRIIC